MNVLSLFDGISVGKVALESLGIKVENYFACEIDKYAIEVSENNHPDIIQLGDVTKVDFTKLPKIDLVLAGSPCQGFSLEGKQLNFEDTRSKLYFEFERALSETNAPHFLLENVKMKEIFKDIISERLGVAPIKINSSLFTAQNRERLYWTNINMGEISLPDGSKSQSLQDILPDCAGVYTVPRGWNKGGIRWGKDKSPCLTTSSWQHNFFWVKQYGCKHKFTRVVAEELQGLPQGYTSAISENQAFKCLGNSWTLPVIEFILSELK